MRWQLKLKWITLMLVKFKPLNASCYVDIIQTIVGYNLVVPLFQFWRRLCQLPQIDIGLIRTIGGTWKSFFFSTMWGEMIRRRGRRRSAFLSLDSIWQRRAGTWAPVGEWVKKKLGCIFCHSISNKGSVGQIEMIIRRSNYKMIRLWDDLIWW